MSSPCRTSPAGGLTALTLLLAGCSAAAPPTAPGDPDHGRIVAIRQACGSCHIIPHLQEAEGLVGPPLTRFGRRAMIAGLLPNTPDQLVRWLKSPQSVKPGNAMPDIGLTDSDAHDLAAWLETLK